MVSSRRFQAIGSLVFLMVALAGSLIWAQPASAASRSEGQEYAANYCAKLPKAYKGAGVADYIWATARNGGDTVTVNFGAKTAPVKINVTGLYCSGYKASKAGSSFWTDKGGISGAFNPYPNNGANNEFDDSQDLTLNITDWEEGWHSVCTDFSTWMDAPTVSSESVKICTSIYLDIRYPWNTDGQSYVGVEHTPNVSEWDAAPGESVTWNHRIWNTTGYSTSEIAPAVERSGFRASSGLNGNQYPWSGARFSLGPNGTYWLGKDTANYNSDTYFKYVITQDDVGAGQSGKPKICQSVSWGPSRQGSDEWKGTSEAPACVNVPYNFDLVPSVAPISQAVEPGATIDVNPSVKNNGPTKSYDDTKWAVSRFIVAPNGTIPSGGTNGTAPCSYYGNGCQPAAPSGSSGQQSFPESPNSTAVGVMNDYAVPDAALGSWLCFALSVQPYSSANGNWRHSTPSCVKIGKKPKLQVWGDDVAVRGSIDTAITKKTNGVFGSWVEYAALSVGTNSQFASGAGLASQTSSAQSAWSALTFANTNVPGGGFGKYTLTAGTFRPLPAIAQYFATGKSTQPYNSGADLNANAFDTGSGLVVRTAGALDLNAGSLPKGRSLVIVAGGTVTIKGNLTYTNGAMTSTRDLSQLVIIAPRIDIEDSVTTVDAWLIADETVNTCSNVTGDLSGKVCNKELAVNGPVVAGKLLLRRTAGSGTGNDSGTPAETFNTRPSTYLWAQLVATGSGRAETVETTELPPRF